MSKPLSKFVSLSLFFISMAFALNVFSEEGQKDSCAQASPKEQAKELGIKLPPLPWHMADVWWTFDKKIEKFESLSVDITIDRNISSKYNL